MADGWIPFSRVTVRGSGVVHVSSLSQNQNGSIVDVFSDVRTSAVKVCRGPEEQSTTFPETQHFTKHNNISENATFRTIQPHLRKHRIRTVTERKGHWAEGIGCCSITSKNYWNLRFLGVLDTLGHREKAVYYLYDSLLDADHLVQASQFKPNQFKFPVIDLVACYSRRHAIDWNSSVSRNHTVFFCSCCWMLASLLWLKQSS